MLRTAITFTTVYVTDPFCMNSPIFFEPLNPALCTVTVRLTGNSYVRRLGWNIFRNNFQVETDNRYRPPPLCRYCSWLRPGAAVVTFHRTVQVFWFDDFPASSPATVSRTAGPSHPPVPSGPPPLRPTVVYTDCAGARALSRIATPCTTNIAVIRPLVIYSWRNRLQPVWVHGSCDFEKKITAPIRIVILIK